MKEISKDKYLIVRKILKGHIIVLWLILFLCPIIVFNWIDEYGSYTENFYVFWWTGGNDFAPYPLYWFFVILYFIGFFLSFGNIKRDYKIKTINRNLGYISTIIVLIGIIGIMSMSITSLIGINDRLHLPHNILINERLGIGFLFAVILIILIFAEAIFLNRINIK